MDKSTPKRGRPRSDESKAAVLAAAFAILRERGYSDMAIEAVAARAGVAKTTIYRWWKNRQELAVEAFFANTTQELAFPDTGSIRQDFRQQIHQLASFLRGPVGEAMAAMIFASRQDPILREALGTRWVSPRRRWGKERIQRAADQGQCVPGIDLNVALEVMYSPIYNRMLFGLGVPTAEEVDAALNIVLPGIFR